MQGDGAEFTPLRRRREVWSADKLAGPIAALVDTAALNGVCQGTVFRWVINGPCAFHSPAPDPAVLGLLSHAAVMDPAVFWCMHRRPVVAADLPTIRALNQVNDATFDSCLHDTSDFLIVATVQGHIVGFVRWVQGHGACGFV